MNKRTDTGLWLWIIIATILIIITLIVAIYNISLQWPVVDGMASTKNFSEIILSNNSLIY